MRTTLAIDDANYERLQRAMHKRGCSFRAMVNQSLRLGLDAIEKPARGRKPFVVRSFPGGPPPGVDWSCASGLLSQLDELDRSETEALEKRQLGHALSASGRALPGSEFRPQPDQREGDANPMWPGHKR